MYRCRTQAMSSCRTMHGGDCYGGRRHIPELGHCSLREAAWLSSLSQVNVSAVRLIKCVPPGAFAILAHFAATPEGSGAAHPGRPLNAPNRALSIFSLKAVDRQVIGGHARLLWVFMTCPA